MTPDDQVPANVRAFLFDLDGTLVETSNRWAEVLARRLSGVQRMLPGLDVESLSRRLVLGIEMPLNYAVAGAERLGLANVTRGLGDRVRRSKGLATRRESVLIDGVLELVEDLAGRYRLGIVTTRARREAHTLLERTGLRRFFPIVVTRQDVWLMKPHQQPVLKAARALGVSPADCAMIGDTVMDVRSARRAGAFAVAVLTGIASREELSRAGAQLVLERAADLRAHLADSSSRVLEQRAVDPAAKGW